MKTNTSTKRKPIPLIDQEALELIIARADREGRSRSNALAFTVKQALGQKQNDTVTACQTQ